MIRGIRREGRLHLYGSGQMEGLSFNLPDRGVPTLLRISISPEGYCPGKIRVRVKSSKEEVIARDVAVEKVSHGLGVLALLKEAGEYKVVFENTEPYDQSITYVLELAQVEQIQAESYFKVTNLGPRSLLVTDGEQMLVMKSLEKIWHYVRGENFSGLVSWLLLNMHHKIGIPKLILFNVEKKYIMYEYIEGEPLDSLVHEESRRTPVIKILEALRDAAVILDVVSKSGVVHRDLKPQHIILSEGKTFIIDWELACRLGECKFPVGLATYAPPEAIQGKYHEKSDVYSFAKLVAFSLNIWSTLEGGTVIESSTLEEIPTEALKELVSLIKQSVSETPDERPSFKEFAEELSRVINICSENEP